MDFFMFRPNCYKIITNIFIFSKSFGLKKLTSYLNLYFKKFFTFVLLLLFALNLKKSHSHYSRKILPIVKYLCR